MRHESNYWSEFKIERSVIEVIKGMCIDRMPSKQEMEDFCGDTKLSNAIQKKGGYRYWADKLNLELKNSETKFGVDVEETVVKAMRAMGYDCEPTPTKYPYDILVEKCAKVDVKAARVTKIRGYSAYSFRLAKPQQTCDFYILVPVDMNGDVIKTYIVPSHITTGHKQICISTNNSKYDKYLGRWDLIDEYVNAMRAITLNN